MRKQMLFILAASMLLCAGCSQNTESTDDTENTEEMTEVTETDDETKESDLTNAAEAAEVVPFDLSYRVYSVEDTLEDGEYSVSFNGTDLAKTDDGYTLTASVCNYELFSASDIEGLKAGDTVVSKEVSYLAESVEKTDGGNIEVNGGYENGGLSFLKEDDFYRVTFPDDRVDYFSVGTVTMPISEDLVLIDATDWTGDLSALDYENPTDDITFGYDELTEKITSDSYWDPNNVTITVQNGQIVKIVRKWVP